MEAGRNHTTKEMGPWRNLGDIEGVLKSTEGPVLLQKKKAVEAKNMLGQIPLPSIFALAQLAECAFQRLISRHN
jgi:hypothetical protein